MMISPLLLLTAVLQNAAPADPSPGDGIETAGVQPVTVVELFTSQGCPRCPDANRQLEAVADADGAVLALAYGVDHWDMMGWRDTFATPAFTERHRGYLAEMGVRAFTPHFLINGEPAGGRYEPIDLAVYAEAAEPIAPLDIARAGDVLRITRSEPLGGQGPLQVWCVAYRPGVQTVEIKGGTNAGRRMSHYNMAERITHLGEWTLESDVFIAQAPGPSPGGGDLAYVILLQEGQAGPIRAAARF